MVINLFLAKLYLATIFSTNWFWPNYIFLVVSWSVKKR